MTSGAGLVQERGDRIQQIAPGDVVRIPPGRKHWHAPATTAMSHLALQGEVGGRVVDWMEKVSDEQYREQPDAR